jgi:DNA ligase 1
MFRPLLAPNKDPLSYPNYFKELRYPLLCSPKYDGIRCIIKNGTALSRTGKPLRSAQVQEMFAPFEHFDGELIVGSPTDHDVYNRTQSHVMSEDKPGEVFYYVFDYTHPDYLHRPYLERFDAALDIEMETVHDRVFTVIACSMVYDEDQLLRYEEECLHKGFEGIMMRDPQAPYKNGRGTFREGIIYKLKRFQDAEAPIIDFKEGMINENEQERSELGYAKRSSSKAGLVSGDTLGAFYVEYQGQLLEIAPGSFNHNERRFMWENKELFLGELLKFRFFAHGVKDKPRFPRAVGIRSKEDV